MNLEPNALKFSVLEVGALLKNNDDATDLPVVCMSKEHMVYSGLYDSQQKDATCDTRGSCQMI